MHTLTFTKKTLKISHGMKPMKILAKFVDEFGNDQVKQDFEAFRLWHSRILQNRYVDGKLCLSIHPLDFMTMSDNNNNWDSCMRWQGGGGDYRLGTVECMNSPFVIVAYLHDPAHPMFWQDYRSSKFGETYTWNSKQWRELFVVQDAFISEIYPYPFQDTNLTNTVLMWIKDLAAQNLGWTYDNEEINMVEKYDNPQVCTEKICFNLNTEAYMYKDFGRMDIHRGRMNIQKVIEATQERWESTHKPNTRYFDTSYGGIATCMWCGRPISGSANENHVLCPACEPVMYCACCGEVLSSRSVRYFDDDDTPYCEECFADKSVEDALSGDYINTDDAMLIYWKLGEDEEGENIYYCNSIYIHESMVGTRVYENYFKQAPHRAPDWGNCYYVTTDDFTDVNETMNLFVQSYSENPPTLQTILADYSLI
jgi:hypothetical protein